MPQWQPPQQQWQKPWKEGKGGKHGKGKGRDGKPGKGKGKDAKGGGKGGQPDYRK